MARTAFALLLDVSDLAARRHFAVATHDAPAGQRREAEQANQTHTAPSGDSTPLRVPPARCPCAAESCGASRVPTGSQQHRKRRLRDYRLIQRSSAEERTAKS